MSGPADILRQLHRYHLLAEDLQNRIKRLPIQLKGQNNKVETQEKRCSEFEDALKQMQVANRERETTLKSTYQKIEKYERQLKEITSKKEYDALQHELADARAQIPILEEEILLAMEEIEEKAAELPQYKAMVDKVRKERDEFEKSMAEREAEMTKQCEEAEQQVEELRVQLPADAAEHYNRLIQHQHGADVLSPVDGQTCRACATEITLQNRQVLLMGKFQKCSACGRILYLAE